mmetsp:Transcript_14916/g.20751  ORF Transcript_14916/g.20751 Transcript_14916/m.20751 type:complete len:91 (-) Transcript_14916:225-497(-)
MQCSGYNSAHVMLNLFVSIVTCFICMSKASSLVRSSSSAQGGAVFSFSFGQMLFGVVSAVHKSVYSAEDEAASKMLSITLLPVLLPPGLV